MFKPMSDSPSQDESNDPPQKPGASNHGEGRSQRPLKPRALFDQALDLASVEERERFLDEACGDNNTLKLQVERLLDAHFMAEGFIPDASGAGASDVGKIIGPYKLLEQIGEGGFGRVYMAEQQEPIRRKVAFKIIKEGMDSRQIIARFEAERQALALMDHPGISRVLDAGVNDQGRLYFVMELVKGIGITEFCDKNHLSTHERLELFVQVCQAVQHAHQRGIIHRDLKPGNILVSLDYGEPTVKVIDFGIAKALNQRLTEKTLFTHYGQMVGTPAYMSPEQAEMTNLDVDTRTDVYSLGVLLYELLTGTTPLSTQELRSVGYGEMQRMIREQDPVLPSTQWSTMEQSARQLMARNRGADEHSIEHHLKGDLDWIVMRAIEKDRRRRYDSPSELIQEIGRFLNDQPVMASPPSLAYRVQKFVKRHRTPVYAGVALFVSLCLGIVFSSVLAYRAIKAEQRAQGETDKANAALIQAKQSEEEARRNFQRTEAINNWLIDDLLQLADPFQGQSAGGDKGASLTLKDAIIDASGTLSERFTDQPDLEGSLRRVIGTALSWMGASEEGVKNLRRARDLLLKSQSPTHRDTLHASYELGWKLAWDYWRRGNDSAQDRRLAEEGRQLLEESFALSEATYGIGDVSTLHFGLALVFHYGNSHAQGDSTKVKSAEKIAARILPEFDKLDLNDLMSAFVVIHGTRAVADANHRQRRFAEAHELYLKAVELEERCRQIHGDYLPSYTQTFKDHAHTLHYFGEDSERARAILEKIVTPSETQVGLAYPTSNILNLLDELAVKRGDFQAVATYREKRATHQWQVGSADDSALAYRVEHLAGAYAAYGNWEKAAEVFGEYRTKGSLWFRNLVSEWLLQEVAGKSEGIPKLLHVMQHELKEFDPAKSRVEALVGLFALSLDAPRNDPYLDSVFNKTMEYQGGQLPTHILKAIHAFRNEEWDGCIQFCQKPLEGRRNSFKFAPWAGFIHSMAVLKSGDLSKAKDAFAHAQHLRQMLIRTGKFHSTWHEVALTEVLRTVAERWIWNTQSPYLNQEGVKELALQWRDTENKLEQVDHAARRRDYGKAAEILRELLYQDGFDFHHTGVWPHYPRKAAVVFLHVRDLDAYWDLCQRMDEVGFLAQSPGADSPVLCMYPWGLPDKWREKLKSHAIWPPHETLRSTHPKTQNDLWNVETHVWRYYCLGQYEECLEACGWLQESHDFVFQSVGHAYAALSHHHLGNTESAREMLALAESDWKDATSYGDGLFNLAWTPQAIFHLALKEAREKIR
jgi:serine/threonine protein kinase